MNDKPPTPTTKLTSAELDRLIDLAKYTLAKSCEQWRGDKELETIITKLCTDMSDPKTTAPRPIPHDLANRVSKVTTIKILQDVHTAVRTMPSRDFEAWLLQRMAQAERMP